MNGTWAGCDTHVSWCDATVLPLVDRGELLPKPGRPPVSAELPHWAELDCERDTLE